MKRRWWGWWCCPAGAWPSSPPSSPWSGQTAPSRSTWRKVIILGPMQSTPCEALKQLPSTTLCPYSLNQEAVDVVPLKPLTPTKKKFFQILAFTFSPRSSKPMKFFRHLLWLSRCGLFSISCFFTHFTVIWCTIFVIFLKCIAKTLTPEPKTFWIFLYL